MSAAIPVTRDELLRWHRQRAHREAMRRQGAPARLSGSEIVTEPNGLPRLAPVVHCDRELPGWSLIPRTVLKGVVR